MNSLTSNRSPWHWLLVIAVASVLGLGVVFATRLPFSTTVMLLLVLVVPFAVLVAPNIEKIGIVIILLDIPLQIDTFIGFDESQADFGAIIGFNFSITTLALVLLYGHWALTHYRRLVENKPIDSHDLPAAPSHRSQKLLRLAFVLPLIYIAFAALSAAGSTDPMRVVYELCLLLQVYLAVLYLFSHMRTHAKRCCLSAACWCWGWASLEPSRLCCGLRGKALALASSMAAWITTG